jgi:enoyl-CoA hydratase/carnithine racemase
MTNWTHFTVTRETARLWRVTFDNPPINLVTPEMIAEFPRLVDEIEADNEVRVVLFESASPDYFLNHYDTSRVAECRRWTCGSPATAPCSASRRPRWATCPAAAASSTCRCCWAAPAPWR